MTELLYLPFMKHRIQCSNHFWLQTLTISGASQHMIRIELDVEIIFDVKVFQGFKSKVVTAATESINKF